MTEGVSPQRNVYAQSGSFLMNEDEVKAQTEATLWKETFPLASPSADPYTILHFDINPSLLSHAATVICLVQENQATNVRSITHVQ